MVFEFDTVRGSVFAFDPASDTLSFTSSFSGSDFRLVRSGDDIVLFRGSEETTLVGAALGVLSVANFVFDNGSVLDPGVPGSGVLIGTAGNDGFDISTNSDFDVDAGLGNDLIHVGNELTATDTVSGGLGEDTVVFSGEMSSVVSFSATTITGIERIEADQGSQVQIALNDAVLSSIIVPPQISSALTFDSRDQSQTDLTFLDASNVTSGRILATAGAGQDTLIGGAGNDNLDGGDGLDSLSGGAGDDTLIGGLGRDTLTGGTGDDVFQVGFASPRSESSPNIADTITDFTGLGVVGGDQLDLPSFSSNLPLVFNSDEIPFDLGAGVGTSGIQLPSELIGDGFVDVVWRQSETPNRVEVWVDANDDGQFSEVDILLYLDNITEPNPSVAIEDFVDNFTVVRLTQGPDSFVIQGAPKEVFGIGGNDDILGVPGNDTIFGGSGNDTLDGGDGNDQLNGEGDDDQLFGRAGVDNLIGGDGNDTLDGGEDGDFLQGGAGDDSLIGGFGVDNLRGGNDNDTLEGGADNDFLSGEAGNDSLLGGDGNDALTGFFGLDTLDGGAGNDTLSADRDADTLTGGDSADVFRLSLGVPNTNIWSGPSTITDFDRDEGDEIDLSFSNFYQFSQPLVFRREIETPVALGDTFDPMDPLGRGFTQMWWQPDGDDVLLIGDLNDNNILDDTDFTIRLQNIAEVRLDDFADGDFRLLVGGPGPDTPLTVVPTAGDDTIYGVGGDDNLGGIGGNDAIFGGSGNDTLDGGDGNDQLNGEGDDDQLFGRAGVDNLIGGDGNDTLDGGEDGDFLQGGAGDDSLIGGFGVDNLRGGNDNDTLEGGADNDFLSGEAGNDSLLGGDGNDALTGFFGLDTLDGGAGNDTLSADRDADTLTGGDSADVFRLSLGVPNTNIWSGPSTITDFDRDEGDEIDLSFSNFYQFSQPLVFRREIETPVALGDTFDPMDPLGRGFTQMWWQPDGDDVLLIGDLNDNNILDDTDFTIRLQNIAEVRLDDFADGDFRLLVGGPGPDTPLTVVPTAGDDTIYGVGGDDNLGGIGGNDAIFGGSGNDTLDGGDGNDLLNGEGDDDQLFGRAGQDNLEGGDGNDTLDGGEDGDFLQGGAGDDSLIGGFGVDNLRGGNDNDTLEGGADNDFLSGEAGNDSLLGGDGNDTLTGFFGLDTLDGGAGNDTLSADRDADTLTGGDSADVFRLSLGVPNTNIWSGPSTITDFDRDEGDEIDLSFSNFYQFSQPLVFRREIETPVALGDTFDPMDPLGRGFTQMWWQPDGDDVLLIGDLNDNNILDDTDFTIRLQNIAEVRLDDFADGDFRLLVGGPGPDTPLTVVPTAGDDTIYGVGGDDNLGGIGGNDAIFGGSGNDTLDGGDGNDLLNGEGDDDQLFGRAGQDNLEGGDGNDTLDGGEDGDFLQGGAGDDSLIGGFGVDNLRGGNDNDTLEGGADNDFLSGEAGNDSLLGGDGNDALTGFFGLDTLDGGAGNDTLSADRDADTLTGGDSADVFRLSLGVPNTNIWSGPSTITDFDRDEGDEIDLSFSNFYQFSQPLVFRREIETPVALGDTFDPMDPLGRGFTQMWWQPDGDDVLLIGDLNDNNILDDTDFTIRLLDTEELFEEDLDDIVNVGPLARDDAINIDNLSAYSDNLFVDNGSGVDFDPEAGSIAVSSVNGQESSVGSTIALGSGALLTVLENGDFTFDPNGAFDSLNAGETTTESFDYTIVDNQGKFATASVFATIGEGVNFAPVLRNQVFLVDENLSAGAPIGIVTAQDPNPSDLLSFAISDGDPDGNFEIDQNTGALTIVNPQVLDFETNPVFGFLVEVADTGGGGLASTATITIRLQDVNEQPTILDPGPISVPENSVSIFQLSAQDVDNDQLVFSILGGADAASFEIDFTTGQLSFASGVDFEVPADVGANNVYDVDVAVSDGGLSDSISIQVTVTDISDTAPTIGDDSLSGSENDDVINGLEGNDALSGGLGADTLVGGQGIDTLTGGPGSDSFNGSASDLDGDIITDFELGDDLLVIGSTLGPGQTTATAGSAILEFDTNGDNAVDSTLTLEGDFTDQKFAVSSVADDTEVSLAGPGAVLLSPSGERFITSDENANQVFGDGGPDVVATGGGDDVVSGGDGADVLLGGAGNDTVLGGVGADNLSGGSGADVFAFNANDFVGDGVIADFVTDFVPGVDKIELSGFGISDSSSIDFVTVPSGVALNLGNGRFVVLEGLEASQLLPEDITISDNARTFSLVSTTTVQELTDFDDRLISVEDQDLEIIGGGGLDALVSGVGDDTIHGGAGSDVISGGAGNDLIVGGQGADNLTGGPGEDVFAFTDGEEVGFTADFITDFEIGLDALRLSEFGLTQPNDLLWNDTPTGIALQLGSSHFVVFEGIEDQTLIEAGAGNWDFG